MNGYGPQPSKEGLRRNTKSVFIYGSRFRQCGTTPIGSMKHKTPCAASVVYQLSLNTAYARAAVQPTAGDIILLAGTHTLVGDPMKYM